jgi:hypothetical protein
MFSRDNSHLLPDRTRHERIEVLWSFAWEGFTTNPRNSGGMVRPGNYQALCPVSMDMASSTCPDARSFETVDPLRFSILLAFHYFGILLAFHYFGAEGSLKGGACFGQSWRCKSTAVQGV